MKTLLVSATILLSTLGCASQKETAKYRKDPVPKFSNSRDYEQKPADLRPSVEKVLYDYLHESNPSTDTDLKAEAGNTIATGWIYGTSRDKYMLVDFNGVPKRISLNVRRKYAVTIASSVAGTLATINVKEEVEELDKKTGSPKGWKSEDPDRALYQRFFSDLDLAVHSR